MMSSVELPRHLLTLEEFNSLPEDNSARFELQEGVLVVTPRPATPHLRAAARIWQQLDEQLPDGLEALIESEVCLDPVFPSTVRVPDVLITKRPRGTSDARAWTKSSWRSRSSPPARAGWTP